MGHRKKRRKQKQWKQQSDWNKVHSNTEEKVIPFSSSKTKKPKTIHAPKIQRKSNTDQIVNVATKIFGGRYYCVDQDT